MENIFDMNARIRGAHSSRSLLTTHDIGSEVIAVFLFFFFRENRSVASFPEMQPCLQSSNMPRVHRASQPATICLKDKTGTLPRYKMQLGESTAVKEELFPNNKGCVLGREGGLLYMKRRIVRMSESTALVSLKVNLSALMQMPLVIAS